MPGPHKEMKKRLYDRKISLRGCFVDVLHSEYPGRIAHSAILMPKPEHYKDMSMEEMAKEFLKHMQSEHHTITKILNLPCAPVPRRIPQKTMDKNPKLKGRPGFVRTGYADLKKRDYIYRGKLNTKTLDELARFFKQAAEKGFLIDSIEENFGRHEKTGKLVVRDLTYMTEKAYINTEAPFDTPEHEEEHVATVSATNAQKFLFSLKGEKIVTNKELAKIIDYFSEKHGIDLMKAITL